MQSIHSYQTFIFDCDGVVLDSNQLKIAAMKEVLLETFDNSNDIAACIEYFKNNFGKSRFHHVDIFLHEIIHAPGHSVLKLREILLERYSLSCKQLYLSAEITPGFLNFLNKLDGKKYIASGSEEKELNWVFEEKGLSRYFEKVYGSPAMKKDIVSRIVRDTSSEKYCVMFGDAISDVNAALANQIDFIGYLPYSNVREVLSSTCIENSFPVYDSWESIV